MKKIGEYTIGFGFLLIVIGFIYDISFAGIPPQDPPLYLQMEYEQNEKIASWIMKSGLIVGGIGGLMKLAASIRTFGGKEK